MTVTLINRLNSRSYPCFLDGQKVYTLMPNDEITLTLPRQDGQLVFPKSRTKPITVHDGDTIILTQTEPFNSLTHTTTGLIYCVVCAIFFSLGIPHWLTITLLLLPFVPYLLFPHFTIVRK